MMDSVLSTLCLGEMFHPPEVMLASITVTPVRCGDLASDTFEVREVVEPVITLAHDSR